MSTAAISTEESHGHDDHGHGHSPFLAHHFESHEQQFDSGKLGMWLFLVTEILFFSGLFCAYTVYRASHPELFTAGHKFLNPTLGAINTVVLLFSSLTMAWAVRCAQLGQKTGLTILVGITIACAVAFLVVKYFEYTHKFHYGIYPAAYFNYEETYKKIHSGDHAGDHGHAAAGDHGSEEFPPPETLPKDIGLYFSIYYCLTGLHGIHIIAGIIALGWIFHRSLRGDFGPEYFGPVDFVGLYWHIVDLIWIYLFPLLYLVH